MNDRLTRRRLLEGTAVGAATLAVPAGAEARKKKPPKKKKAAPKPRSADVIVVGAGLAGLTAARNEAKAGKSVLVLEGRGRVGGRPLNHEMGGGKTLDAGAQFVGPTQDHVLAL